MSTQVSIQDVLKNYNQRIIKLEKLNEAQQKFDLESFQNYVDKIDEMCTFMKKQQWELGHTCNTLETRVNELTMLVGNLITKHTTEISQESEPNNLSETTETEKTDNITLKVQE